MSPWPESYILKYRHRERIGLLEYHAYPSPKLYDVDFGVIDRYAIELDVPAHSSLGNKVIHAIKETK
jgi:hypothetical protein